MSKNYDKNGRQIPDLNIAHDNEGNPIGTNGVFDIFSDGKLDEMQKAYSYKIAFSCFRFIMIFMILFSVVLFGVYMMTESIPVMILSYIFLAVWFGTYTFYAVKTSSKGVMDESLAKKMGKANINVITAAYTFSLILLTVLALGIYFKEGESWQLASIPFYAIAIGTNIVLVRCAERNRKVNEERDSEEEESGK